MLFNEPYRWLSKSFSVTTEVKAIREKYSLVVLSMVLFKMILTFLSVWMKTSRETIPVKALFCGAVQFQFLPAVEF